MTQWNSAKAQGVTCESEPTIGMEVKYGDSIDCVFEEVSDLDSFQFVGQIGDRPYIQVRNSGNTAGTTSQKRMILYGPSGNLIDEVLPGYTRVIDVTLTENGIHTIVVEHTSRGNATDPLDYQLELPCLAGKCAVSGLPSALGYTAVKPCRIVDTRYGVGGVFSAGETRHFRVYGNISDQNQDGGGAPSSYPTSCPFLLGEPSAVHINLTVVPRGPLGEGGWAAVWPWNESQPSVSWLNYRSGEQNVANAGTVATTVSSSSDPDISVRALRSVDIIIDVLGYYTD
jgi:hypothetical protein